MFLIDIWVSHLSILETAKKVFFVCGSLNKCFSKFSTFPKFFQKFGNFSNFPIFSTIFEFFKDFSLFFKNFGIFQIFQLFSKIFNFFQFFQKIFKYQGSRWSGSGSWLGFRVGGQGHVIKVRLSWNI